MERSCIDILRTKVTCINANNGMYSDTYQQKDITVLDCLTKSRHGRGPNHRIKLH